MDSPFSGGEEVSRQREKKESVGLTTKDAKSRKALKVRSFLYYAKL